MFFLPGKYTNKFNRLDKRKSKSKQAAHSPIQDKDSQNGLICQGIRKQSAEFNSLQIASMLRSGESVTSDKNLNPLLFLLKRFGNFSLRIKYDWRCHED